VSISRIRRFGIGQLGGLGRFEPVHFAARIPVRFGGRHAGRVDQKRAITPPPVHRPVARRERELGAWLELRARLARARRVGRGAGREAGG